jgi:hypothetical protein
MKRSQTISHGVTAVDHAIRSGDRPIGGSGVNLSEAGFAWEDVPMPDGELRRRAATAFPPGDYDYLSEIGLASEALVQRRIGAAFIGCWH